jgi:hypothetical protein
MNVIQKAEVEAIVRSFPEVLSRRKEIDWNDDRDEEEDVENYFPLKLLAFTRGEEYIWFKRESCTFYPSFS